MLSRRMIKAFRKLTCTNKAKVAAFDSSCYPSESDCGGPAATEALEPEARGIAMGKTGDDKYENWSGERATFGMS